MKSSLLSALGAMMAATGQVGVLTAPNPAAWWACLAMVGIGTLLIGSRAITDFVKQLIERKYGKAPENPTPQNQTP